MGRRRYQIDDIIVQLCQALIERDQPTLPSTSELRKISIGDLPMPDDATQRNIAVRNGIRPELVPLILRESGQHSMSDCRRLPLANHHPSQATLRTGATCKMVIRTDQPALSRGVVNMIIDDQRDEYVRVEQRSHCTSSSSARTSSVVMTFPT